MSEKTKSYRGMRVPLPSMDFEDRYAKFVALESAIEYRLDMPLTRESMQALDMLRSTQNALIEEELQRIQAVTNGVMR